jgi:hypothetical protein
LSALEFENLFNPGKRFLPEGGADERNMSGYMDPTVGKAKTAREFFLKRFGVDCRRWNLRTYLNLVSGFCRRGGMMRGT